VIHQRSKESPQRSKEASRPVPTGRLEAPVVAMLEKLLVHPKLTRSGSQDALKLAVLAFSPEIREPWLNELARYQRACGCDLGAAGGIVGLVAASAWQLTHLNQLTFFAFVVGMLEVLGTAIISTVFGKIVGLALARFRFRRATRNLIGHISRFASSGT
jgi:hypothetical protein